MRDRVIELGCARADPVGASALLAILALASAGCHGVEAIGAPEWEGLGAFVTLTLQSGAPPLLLASERAPTPRAFTAQRGQVTLAQLGYEASLSGLHLFEGQVAGAIEGRPKRALPRPDRSWVQVAGELPLEDQPLPEVIRGLSIDAPGCERLIGEEVRLPGGSGHVRWLLPWSDGAALVGTSFFDEEAAPVAWRWFIVRWPAGAADPVVTTVQIPFGFDLSVAFPGDGCVWLARTPGEGGCYAPLPGQDDWQRIEDLPQIATSTTDVAIRVAGPDRPGDRDLWWITKAGRVFRTTFTGTVLVDGDGNQDPNNGRIHLAWLGPGDALVLQGNRITEHVDGQRKVYPLPPGLGPLHRLSSVTPLDIVVTTRDDQRSGLLRLERDSGRFTQLELTGDFVDIGDVAFEGLSTIGDALFIPADNGYLLELAPIALDDLGVAERYDLCPVSQVGGGDLQFVIDDGQAIWAAGRRDIDPTGEPAVYRIRRR